MRKVVGERKERVDKKRDVKPTIPIHLYDCVSDLSYICNAPIKDVVEFICTEGIDSKRVVEYMSKHFKRNYWHNNTMYKGNRDLYHNRYINRNIKSSRRISTRFTKDFYERIDILAGALDYTPSSATGFLLECSIKNINIIDRLVSSYTSSLDDSRKDVLKNVVKYLNKDNPYRENIGLLDIVKYIIEDIRDWSKS